MNIEKINNYRSFIRDYLSRRSPKGRGEIARMAQFLGVHSTFVSQVLGGSKDFSLEQAYSAAEYLNLSEIEKKYFLLLLQKDRAGSAALKNFFKEELETLKKSMLKVSNQMISHRDLTDTEKAMFYASWIYSAIRLYCSIGNGKTLEDIVEHFSISRQKALQILDFLCEKNLCTRDGNRFKMGTQHTHIPNDSPFIIRHHMNWRTKALQQHEALTDEELAFTAPMSISAKDFATIREKILSCIKDSIEIAKKSEAEDLAFITIDWQWIK